MSKISSNRKYQAMFILDTRGYQDTIETLISKLEAAITGIQGENLEVNDLGQKQFARVTDKKFPAGHYVQIQFDGPSTSAEQLQHKFKLDKNVNRILLESV